MVARSPRSTGFSFTWNNYDESVEKYLRELSGVKYLVAGREIGESGTKHIQGTVVFANKKSLTAVIALLKGAHVEISRDVTASIVYCKKEKDFFEMGVYKSRKDTCLAMVEKRKLINKLCQTRPLQELVDEGLLHISQVPLIKRALLQLKESQLPYNHPTTRGYFIFGPPGTGKSHYAKQRFQNAFRKAQNKWFDGYQNEENIIMDDLDTSCLGHYLKIWMDCDACYGESKFGTIQLQHKAFVVTSNFSLDELYADLKEKAKEFVVAIARRCEIIQFLDYCYYIVKQERPIAGEKVIYNLN